MLAPVIWRLLDEARGQQDGTVHTSRGLVDTVGINRVWIVHLGGVLGSSEASKGGNAEGNGGTHDDGLESDCRS